MRKSSGQMCLTTCVSLAAAVLLLLLVPSISLAVISQVSTWCFKPVKPQVM